MDYFESDPELPPEIENVDIIRRNNTLITKAVSTDDSLNKYTPTAQLRTSMTENRVYEEESPRAGAPNRGSEEEEEIPPEFVEFACLKGDLETVLQNTMFQYPVFFVLRKITMLSEKGTLIAITEESDELQTTRIVEDEMRAASAGVVENPQQNGSSSSGIN